MPGTKGNSVRKTPIVIKKYKCSACGEEFNNNLRMFVKRTDNYQYMGNDAYATVCISCMEEVRKTYAKLHGNSDKMGFLAACQLANMYFDEELYDELMSKGPDQCSVINYARRNAISRHYADTFTDYVIEYMDAEPKIITKEEALERQESRTWEKSDDKNKRYVLSHVGYDPFADEKNTQEERQFLFNTLADYLTDDVIEDPHKLQMVVSLVKTILQAENIDKHINFELRKPSVSTEEVSRLTNIKKSLSNVINSIAVDNGISTKKTSEGKNGRQTLSFIMKEMLENGVHEAKVNVYDAKMAEAFQAIAKCNADALIAELNLQSDEYAEMVAEQRPMIESMQQRIEALEEELRLERLKAKNLVVS